MPEVKLDCTLVMESDWHVGSGGGRHGAVDRLLDRDGERLPYVPASTLRGVWRDAAERLALGLDGNTAGAWQGLVQRIFGCQPAQGGNPGRGCLILEDVRLPAGLRARVRKDARLREALTFIKPGVAIDAVSGRARDDFLRFEEMGRAGTVLRAQGLLRLPDGVDARQVQAFLLAAALLVERIGGKRRRGAGRCRLQVQTADMTAQDAVKMLEQHEKPPEWPTENDGKDACIGQFMDAAEDADAKAAGGWLEIPLLASVETPVIIPQQVMGNVVTMQDHIPGTYLLHHVAKALGGAGMDDPWAHIAAGDVQVLPLFPCNRKGERSLPMPMCLQAPKGDDSDKVKTRNRLEAASEEASGIQYKGLKGGYVWPQGATSLQWLSSVPQVLRTHNTVEDSKQRPTEAVGGVFTFEAIAPGIRLGGALRINKVVVDGLNVKALRNGLAATLHVGRASRMGYGRIRLQTGQEGEKPAISASSGDLVLLLTSDLILPGDALSGATHLDAVVDAVEQTLGRQGLFDREQARAHPAVRRIEGWQQRWGLPRPTLVAIAAGSVMRLPLAEGKMLDEAMLQRLAAGLGERRGEGFGQVMVNPPFLQHAELTVGKADDDAITISEGAAGASEVDAEIANALQRFEELVEEAAWRRAIIEAAEAAASDKGVRENTLKWGTRKPGSSQLGVLRSLLLSEPGDDAASAGALLERLKSWVEHVNGKDGAADRWGGKDVLNALLELVDPQQSKIWQVLQDGLKGEGWPGTLNRQPTDLKEHLHLFAARMFLLRAMHHHRRMLEGEDEQTADGHQQQREAAS